MNAAAAMATCIAKISEHAFGNAIDIASFRLADKKSMAVANRRQDQDLESRWLMALRISACGYFTTVLGPGSNAAHAEHYHFDLGLHGKIRQLPDLRIRLLMPPACLDAARRSFRPAGLMPGSIFFSSIEEKARRKKLRGAIVARRN